MRKAAGRQDGSVRVLVVSALLAAGLVSSAPGASGSAPPGEVGQAILEGGGDMAVFDGPSNDPPSGPLARSGEAGAAAASTPQPYPIYPQADILGQDLQTVNFVDLDPTSSLQDWDCSQYTYDGHKGHDSVIRSFREQAIGVPVFAALDGTVTDVHDGEFDMVVSPTGSEPANYVRLNHGGTHETWYFHLRKNSVSVSVGQYVVAGTQIGLTASSGNSTAPHLHFESRFDGASYEPSAGPCRAGASNWVQQVPIRRDLYVRDFTFSPNTFAGLPAPPNDTAVRTGSVPQGTQRVYFRRETANQGPQLPWRIRVLRPGGVASVDFSGTFGNATLSRNPYWYFNVDVDLNQTGAWRVLVDIANQTYVDAPLTVVATAA